MDGKITLVTGGARSGKSSFSEELVKKSSLKAAYLATAIPFDEGMKDRIKKHQMSRPQEWTTYEGFRDMYLLIPKIAKEHKIILLDCVTIMVTNLMFEHKNVDWNKVSYETVDQIEASIREQFQMLIQVIRQHQVHIIMVTNELGMGIVPENRLSRIFRDIAGRINQMIAQEADEVYLVVSGLPVKLK
ncbi:MAG: bifunctional adenosylcobinamide kinase/adenosylcobinamide-phosphate guanylyltransferase [Bacillota bacterium]